VHVEHEEVLRCVKAAFENTIDLILRIAFELQFSERLFTYRQLQCSKAAGAWLRVKRCSAPEIT